MKKEIKRDICRGLCLLGVFILWTGSVCLVDVQPVGPTGTAVGFATVNRWFHQRVGVCMGLYTVTDWLGILPLLVMAGFAGLGLAQWIRRGGIRKVDPDILTLGVFYLAVLAAYLPYYAAHNADLTAPYEGVIALLEELKRADYRLAVVSNKHAPGVQALTARFFGEYMDLGVGADGTRPLKPAPDGLLYAMEQLGVTAADVWYVGDSAQDVMTAHAAGVKCVAVAWGFQDEERLLAERPTAVAHTVEEAKKVILSE